jgi:methionyl-tRNA synthetase
VTRTALNLLRVCASVSAPIIPETSARVLTALGEAEAATWPEPEALTFDALPRGATMGLSI